MKTEDSRRVVEITSDLANRLGMARLERHPEGSGPDDLVFVSRAGTPFCHRNLDRRLSKSAKASGTAAPLPTAHDLRHTHASRLIADGWDVQSIADRLGHANVMAIYVHEFDKAGRSDERRARLEALYGKNLESTESNREQQTTDAGLSNLPAQAQTAA